VTSPTGAPAAAPNWLPPGNSRENRQAMGRTSWPIRQRVEADLGPCLALLQRVHGRDRYPLVWPDDPIDWLQTADAIGGWVCESDGGIAGQVLLRRPSGPPVRVWEEATGMGADRLAVVSRLFVDPLHRCSGIGRELLATAATEARRRSLRPVLDVLIRGRAAVRLYEEQGWTRVEQFVWDMPDGSQEPAWAYALG